MGKQWKQSTLKLCKPDFIQSCFHSVSVADYHTRVFIIVCQSVRRAEVRQFWLLWMKRMADWQQDAGSWIMYINSYNFLLITPLTQVRAAALSSHAHNNQAQELNEWMNKIRLTLTRPDRALL